MAQNAAFPAENVGNKRQTNGQQRFLSSLISGNRLRKFKAFVDGLAGGNRDLYFRLYVCRAISEHLTRGLLRQIDIDKWEIAVSSAEMGSVCRRIGHFNRF